MFCPKVLAGINNRKMPDTIVSRSITITLERMGPGDQVERLYERDEAAATAVTREQIEAWVDEHADELDAYRISHEPELLRDLRPLRERMVEAWESLLAIAMVAGHGWAERAKRAALELSGAKDREETRGAHLLRDLRRLFGDREFVETATLLDGLNNLPESPWGSWNGDKGLKARNLARELSTFSIKPRQKKIAPTVTHRGYSREDFIKPWQRYLRDEAAAAETATVADGVADNSALEPGSSGVAAKPEGRAAPVLSGLDDDPEWSTIVGA